MVVFDLVVRGGPAGRVASDGFDSVVRFLFAKPLAIVGILVAAFVVNKIVRRLVKLLCGASGIDARGADRGWSDGTHPRRCVTPASL